MRRLVTWLCLGFVTVLSFYTYFYNFQNPQAFFWDENYHIASAQKYLNGVYFMEQHPPLGKLLIAAGETIWSVITPEQPASCREPNARIATMAECTQLWIHNAPETEQLFLGTDYASDPPRYLIMTGYRLMPALLGWLTAPLVFLIFLVLLKRPVASMLLSFLYVFDNAMIVHLRGAMLEGPLMFFSALTILCFVLALEWREVPKKLRMISVLFGFAFGLTLTTKVVGLIFILLLPALLIVIFPNWKKMVMVAGLFAAGFLISYVSVWQTHFTLGSRIIDTNNDRGFYQASEKYKEILKSGTNGSLLNFPVMINDSWRYVSHYNGGVPPLDLCKEDENGSPFFYWPFGGRSISYRWETNDSGKTYQYLYLQSNPLVWALGLSGVVLTVVLLLGSLLFDLKTPLRRPWMMCVFLMLYVGYMVAVSRLDRVMYLYHYFLPLLFSFFLFGLAYDELSRLGKFLFTEWGKAVALVLIATGIVMTWQFYHPFSYYEPMSSADFEKRNVMPLWDLHCVGCERNNYTLRAKS